MRTAAFASNAVVLLALIACRPPETVMSPTEIAPETAPVIAPFTPLEAGFSQAIPAGGRVSTLGANGVTWWEDGEAVTVPLPGVPLGGPRWSSDGATLWVGLGRVDAASRRYTPLPTLTSWNPRHPIAGPAVRAAAWLDDGSRVALIRQEGQDPAEREVVVVNVADGSDLGRQRIEGAETLVAAGDRILVAGRRVILLDASANRIAEPDDMPPSVVRVRYDAGAFLALGVAGPIALLEPAHGELIATWDLRAVDAVPIEGGALAVDLSGEVYLACTDGADIHTVTHLDSGVTGPVIGLVGNRIVVAGAGANPVRVATLTGGCNDGSSP